MTTLALSLQRFGIAALLCALVGCGGFAADGGPIGTGIAASVAGNVVAVVDDASVAQEDAPVDVPQVVVSIDEVPGAETTTDAGGNFALEGDFAGALTLRFRSRSTEATQAIDVPAGALVVLADVVVAPGEVDAEAGRQVGFLARVLSADCAGGRLAVEDDRKPPRPFTVELVDDTRIVRSDGSAATCAEIAAGDRVAIDGVFEPGAGTGSSVTALSLTLGAARSTRPDVVEDVPFLGFVAAIDCSRGTLTVSDARQRTRLRLTPDTDFVARGGGSLACAAVRVGDRVSGLGRLRVRQPGRIEATRVVVASGGGAIDLRLAGAVVGKDCARNVLQIDDGDGVAAVQIVPTTAIEPALTCDEIPLGARVRGLGRVRRDAPDLVVAVELRIRRPAR